MNNSNSKLFGLNFEEKIIDRDSIIFPSFCSPVYDEELNISVYIDENGNKMPCVELEKFVSTKTRTRVSRENSDPDADMILSGPKTRTYVDQEDSDEINDGVISCFRGEAIINCNTSTKTRNKSLNGSDVDSWQ